MIYRIVSSLIILGIVFEICEVLFPANKMNNFVKSFALIILLQAILEMFL